MERRIVLAPDVSTVLQQWGTRGPAILCVHGITSSRRSWARLGGRLHDCARVFAYDQRGHGDSAAVAGPMTLGRSVDDLAAVVADLGLPIDLLVGHSWGGAVALLGGRRILPKGVLAIDPMIRVVPGTFDAEYVDDLRATFASKGAEREAAIRAMYEDGHPSDVAAKLHAMMPMEIGALERLGQQNEVDAGAWNIRKDVANYPVPLEILQAGIDSVMSADDLAYVSANGGPNVTITTFANEGHNLHRDAFGEFAAIVAARVGLRAAV